MHMISLRVNKDEIETRFVALQNEKIERFQHLLDERMKIHQRMHQMPTIRVVESDQHRRVKMEILKPLTADRNKRSATKKSISTNKHLLKFRNCSQDNDNSDLVNQSGMFSATHGRHSSENSSAILNYKTLQELNAAFFSHKNDEPGKNKLIKEERPKKLKKLKDSTLVKFADQPITIEEARSSISKFSSSK